MHTSAMSPLQLWILATSLATSGTELDACPLAHWEFFRAFGGWPGRLDHELSDQAASLSTCRHNDVSRRRHVVTQPLSDIRKPCLFF